MPNMADRISTVKMAIPRTSIRRDTRSELAGMNLITNPTSTMPIGTLTRKMPRQVQ